MGEKGGGRGEKRMSRAGRFAGTVLLFAMVSGVGAACSDANGEPTPTSTLVATQDQQGQTTTIVPGVTKGTETAATDTPSPPGEPPEVRLVAAFPGLGDVARPVELIAGDDRESELLVVLQDGRIISIVNSPDAPEPRDALDIREQVSRDGNEEGLLGIAIRPEELGTSRGSIFLYYSVADGQRRTRLSRMDWSRTSGRLVVDPNSELVILEIPQPFANHNGGKIAFGPDGFLYVGLGDGGSGGDPQGNGQNLATLPGSILRIDVANAIDGQPYTIPADNPFAGETNARGEIWAYGLRNPWRFSFDAQGRLWAGDVGQGKYEEINLVVAGGNYGWNVVEGTECYRDGCDPSQFNGPIAVYGHDGGDCSVTGGVVHEAKDSEALRGWYFFADFCSGRVRAFQPEAAEIETFVVLEEGPPVASIAHISRGLLLLSFDGRIYRLAAD